MRRPEFGGHIHNLVFAPLDATTEGLAILYVQKALERWEPRIDLQAVDVSADAYQNGLMLIEIKYVIKETHDERSIVHPFYLTGEEEPL